MTTSTAATTSTTTSTATRTATRTAQDAEADRALKARHRAMWALGDYPAVVHDLIGPLGPALVRAAGVRPGDRVLDAAAGTGNAAVPAALAGAEVTATDLTPELIDVGRREAEERGATLAWATADAEALPYADGAFDVALSCVGVMFAPHHRTAADELLRVVRPGGTVAVLSWTPAGFIGQMFATMKPYAPAPPPGAQPPPLWGDEAHVRELFGDRVTDLDARTRTLPVDRFARAEDVRDYFKAVYGPTIAVYRSIADDPERVAALDRDLADLVRRFDRGTTSTTLEWEYLLVVARRAG